MFCFLFRFIFSSKLVFEYGVVQLSQELCQPWSLSKPPLQIYSGIFANHHHHQILPVSLIPHYIPAILPPLSTLSLCMHDSCTSNAVLSPKMDVATIPFPPQPSFSQIFLPGGNHFQPPPLTLLNPSPLHPFRGWCPTSSG